VISPALKEGKVVYEKEAPAAGRSARMAHRARSNLARARSRIPRRILRTCVLTSQAAEKAIKSVFSFSGASESLIFTTSNHCLGCLNGEGSRFPRYVLQRMHSSLRV